MRVTIMVALLWSGISAASAQYINAQYVDEYLGNLPPGSQPPATFTNPYGKNLKLFNSQGQYRGNLSSNPYDPNRAGNPYGRHGSPYSPYRQDSPNNPYGQGIGVYR
jgi:hypothetical protein